MKVTEIIGLYGAALSSVVAYRQWRAAHPRLTITTVHAYNGPGFEPVGRFMRANISNRGAGKVYVRQVFVQLMLRPLTFRDRLRYVRAAILPWRGDGQMAVPLPAGTVLTPALPVALEPGQSLVVWVPEDQFAALCGGRVRAVRVTVQDEGDRSYYSKAVRHW